MPPNPSPSAAADRPARIGLAAALCLALMLLWSLTHRYAGLGGDAELYAFQAMARLHPNLSSDLYLRFGSQDRYTVFSPFYAAMIGWFGLSNSALALTFVFKGGFFAAAWVLVRRFASRGLAFLAVSLLIVTSGRYGAFNVFHYAEDWITARSPAEALVVAALALHTRGAVIPAFLTGAAALMVHPLMALPGVLLLLALSLPLRTALWGAAAGVAGALGVAWYAVHAAKPDGLLAVMDPAWLEVVRERSKFLLLQTWSFDDWRITARPLLSLALCALVLDDPKARKLGTRALLVGASGMAVALIGSCVGPVAALLQGQAWRWIWVSACAGLLLVPSGATRLWRASGRGPLAAALLVAGWAVDAADGALLIALALPIWLSRDRICPDLPRDSRPAAALVGAAALAWAAMRAWPILPSALWRADPRPDALAVIRDLLKLEPLALALAWVYLRLVRALASTAALGAVCAALLLALGVTLPAAVHGGSRVEVRPLAPELQEWRRVIPPDANVLVVPNPVSPALAWFSLQRPSYLSIDQSSGVVFSRATAEENRRRSEVVRPVWDSTWRLSSRHAPGRGGASSSSLGSFAPLTAAALAQMCRDPDLGFVVARERVGLTAAAAPRGGPWLNWNLYDCRGFRAGVAPP